MWIQFSKEEFVEAALATGLARSQIKSLWGMIQSWNPKAAQAAIGFLEKKGLVRWVYYTPPGDPEGAGWEVWLVRRDRPAGDGRG
ncbi:MAG: hypothetical protein KM310_06855 [Clostridiales bacterium]|nr:hypothetical protein [Clostridiales bacterium]